MKGAIISQVGIKRKRTFLVVNKYFFSPLRAGLFGYSAFFCILIISKYFGYVIGNRELFLIDQNDVLLSLIGFVFVFSFRILENYRGKE